MAKLVALDTFQADDGNLTVFEKIIPGNIKRMFYINSAGACSRGGHRHHKAWNALICIQGSCRVYCHDGRNEDEYWLDQPHSCLIVAPEDWHVMDQFSQDAILLVLSNEFYSIHDYIDEPYTGMSALAGAEWLPTPDDRSESMSIPIARSVVGR